MLESVRVSQRFSMLGKERCKFSPYLRVSLLQHAWPWKRLLYAWDLKPFDNEHFSWNLVQCVGKIQVFTELIPLPLGRDLTEIQRPHFLLAGSRAEQQQKHLKPETMPQWSGKREMGSMQDCRSLICPTSQDFQTFPPEGLKVWLRNFFFGASPGPATQNAPLKLRDSIWAPEGTVIPSDSVLQMPWYPGRANSSADGSISYSMPMW